MLYRRIKMYKRRILLLLLLILVMVFFFSRFRASSVDAPPAEAIKSISTDEKICSVTLSLTGVESEEAIRLFMSVCLGTGIKPCIFVTTDWLEEHADEPALLEGAELGLLFSKPPHKWTSKRTMAAIAEANESFMTYTGSFPKYVRIAEGTGNQTVAVALNSYGQLLIGHQASLAETPSAGFIVDCGMLDSTTGYTLAQYYGSTLSQGYAILPLSELLSK